MFKKKETGNWTEEDEIKKIEYREKVLQLFEMEMLDRSIQEYLSNENARGRQNQEQLDLNEENVELIEINNENQNAREEQQQQQEINEIIYEETVEEIIEVQQIENTVAMKFECKFCGKGVKYRNHIRRHMRTHEDIKIQCKFCDKTFTRKDNLKDHEESCLKTFHCDICNQEFKFNREFDFKRHMQTHQNNIHTCQFCGKQLSRKDALLRHMRNQH